MTDERFFKRITRQRDVAILRSVITCFSEHGCFDTKLDQVAEQVGVGKGTLYRHYGSRELLFDAALVSGVQALVVQCQGIWDTHAADPGAALHAVIGEFLSLNHRRDPVSPGALSRLGCSCKWSSVSHSDDQNIEFALVPLARSWQAAGLFDAAADPCWLVAVTIALVNSPVVDRESLDTAGMARRIVEVLGRAFAPARRAIDHGTETPMEDAVGCR